MSAYYEWAVEETDRHNGDVLDVNHYGSYAEALEASRSSEEFDPLHAYEIVLVRDNQLERVWAYMKDGFLPEYFRDAYNNLAGKVPSRFHKEIVE